MTALNRERCAVTGANDLEHLYTFRQFPVFMGCTDQPQDKDLHADMDWWISRSSGLIQLKQLLPLDVLYPESHGAGAVGALWERHHREFAQFVHRYAPRAVLEIGGAHGILAREYQALASADWTILEPNPSPVPGCNAQFIKGFFDDKFRFDRPCDTVVHSHLFEHIYEPAQFMEHLSGFMTAGQHLIFTLPHMQIMLERCYTNCINFEHTVFLTEPYIEYLLSKFGFKLLTKEYFLDDHSIFYAAVRDPSVVAQPLPTDLYQKNKQLYQAYVDYHDALIADLNDRVGSTQQPVYLFGAHVFAQYLLAFGLKTDKIISLLDNDPKKQVRRLYGTHLRVQSPAALRHDPNPVVILKAGVYNAEIKKDILENINPNTVFFE
jgi:hypothetical protein